MKEITIILVCRDETVDQQYKHAKETLGEEITEANDLTRTLRLIEPSLE